MSEPTLVPRDALTGVRVGLSVSTSADLPTLGLTEQHCELVVAELTRSLLLAGATVVYGGRLKPEGYTRILLDEVQRYQEGSAAVEIVLAESEYQKLTTAELDLVAQRLYTLGRLRLITAEGHELRMRDRPATARSVHAPTTLTAMRQYVAEHTHARVVVGGQLDGYQGHEPGVIEEARLTAEHGGLVYAAAGYGGAAAAIAFSRSPHTPAWAPPEFPRCDTPERLAHSIHRLQDAERTRGPDGLSDADRAVLESSHRPADIAALVVRGLARAAREDLKPGEPGA